MSQLALYAYAQTRLQARHGNRPDEHVWQRLEGIKALSGYLQNARRTVLRPWVLALHAHDDYHAVETGLMQQYRQYVNEVASWQPQQWRMSVCWVQFLPDMPVLQHLLGGNTAPAWMLDDPRFKLYSTTNPEQRFEYLRQSSYAPLLQLWQSGMTLPDAWVRHWQDLWPENNARYTCSIDKLTTLLRAHLELFSNSPLSRTWQARELLAGQLTSMFRKYSFQPVAAFIHLALVALDLERLRGEIMRRELFTSNTEAEA